MCEATARSTGVRCRNVALRGVATCLKHGGRGLQIIARNRAAKYAAFRKEVSKRQLAPREIPRK
jgi:hypothetical protein